MTETFSRILAARLDGLPARMQQAARWIAAHPRDVALVSMREQARKAGVQPATMTRLAQALGYDGYDALRAEHATALRHAPSGLAQQADGRLPLHADSPDSAAQALLMQAQAQIAGMTSTEMLGALCQAADAMTRARRIYVLGLRSSHAVAWHLHYALSLITNRAHLLDGVGGTGLDALWHAGTDDVLFVCGVAPYTRAVVEATLQAQARKVQIIAVTDSRLSPLVAAQGIALIVPTGSASFLHAMTPAFLIADTLAALVARADDPGTLARLQGLDRQLAALNTFISHPREA